MNFIKKYTNNYPKYKVATQGPKFILKRKDWWFPVWGLAEDGYWGAETYSTFEKATLRIEDIIQREIKEQLAKKQTQNNITNEEMSVKLYIQKYPERLL